MDILKHKKEAKTNFCNLVQDYKIINEQDVVVRKSKRVEYTPSKLYENKRKAWKKKNAIKDTITRYKEIIFGGDSLICVKCLDELWKQWFIDKKVCDQKLMYDTIRKLAWDGLQKNIAVDCDTMRDRKTAEVLDSEFDYSYWKD